MKFGQLIKYKSEIFFLRNYTQNVMEKIDFFLKNLN